MELGEGAREDERGTAGVEERVLDENQESTIIEGRGKGSAVGDSVSELEKGGGEESAGGGERRRGARLRDWAVWEDVH